MMGKYYKNLGHSTKKCYKLHGYPPDFGFEVQKNAACVQASKSQSIRVLRLLLVTFLKPFQSMLGVTW